MSANKKNDLKFCSPKEKKCCPKKKQEQHTSNICGPSCLPDNNMIYFAPSDKCICDASSERILEKSCCGRDAKKKSTKRERCGNDTKNNGPNEDCCGISSKKNSIDKDHCGVSFKKNSIDQDCCGTSSKKSSIDKNCCSDDTKKNNVTPATMSEELLKESDKLFSAGCSHPPLAAKNETPKVSFESCLHKCQLKKPRVESKQDYKLSVLNGMRDKMGYFEKDVCKSKMIKRTKNAQGVVCEEKQKIVVKKERYDPSKRSLDDNEDDEKLMSLTKFNV